jgi:hypothetical protein
MLKQVAIGTWECLALGVLLTSKLPGSVEPGAFEIQERDAGQVRERNRVSPAIFQSMSHQK